jgi:16S rRNA (guanine527-N7)-methyltransferase
MTDTAAEFAHELAVQAPRYDVQLAPTVLARLTAYFQLTDSWNARLHLVAPTTPAKFATRHVLESLVALRFISEHAHVVDVGSGAGLPVIPCLVVRTDLRATLIEAATKKTIFLREALSRLELRERAQVRAGRFEQMRAPGADFVTCRALERFTKMLPRLVGWSPPASTLLLFGGPTLREKIEQLALAYDAVPMPETEQRFLFRIKRDANKTG